jgi:hypothetical protein
MGIHIQPNWWTNTCLFWHEIESYILWACKHGVLDAYSTSSRNWDRHHRPLSEPWELNLTRTRNWLQTNGKPTNPNIWIQRPLLEPWEPNLTGTRICVQNKWQANPTLTSESRLKHIDLWRVVKMHCTRRFESESIRVGEAKKHFYAKCWNCLSTKSYPLHKNSVA